jgi:5-methylcytosine-specific restriction endonuclease McrA
VRRAVADRYPHKIGGSVQVKCAYCDFFGTLTRFSWGWVHFDQLELDHVVAESKGGPTTADNLTLACRPCNRKKGAR